MKTYHKKKHKQRRRRIRNGIVKVTVDLTQAPGVTCTVSIVPSNTAPVSDLESYEAG